jgi:hypothetical protein
VCAPSIEADFASLVGPALPITGLPARPGVGATAAQAKPWRGVPAACSIASLTSAWRSSSVLAVF